MSKPGARERWVGSWHLVDRSPILNALPRHRLGQTLQSPLQSQSQSYPKTTTCKHCRRVAHVPIFFNKSSEYFRHYRCTEPSILDMKATGGKELNKKRGIALDRKYDQVCTVRVTTTPHRRFNEEPKFQTASPPGDPMEGFESASRGEPCLWRPSRPLVVLPSLDTTVLSARHGSLSLGVLLRTDRRRRNPGHQVVSLMRALLGASAASPCC